MSRRIKRIKLLEAGGRRIRDEVLAERRVYEEGDRRGSIPPPSLEPLSADTCFSVLPDVAETA